MKTYTLTIPQLLKFRANGIDLDRESRNYVPSLEVERYMIKEGIEPNKT